MTRPYPAWICIDCGRQYARRAPNPYLTWHDGDSCGVCGKETATTEPRDFGHLKPGWKNHKEKP